MQPITANDAIAYLIDNIEGTGTVANDAGKGLTKFGINQTANPDIDVANLTRDAAHKVYKQRYWDAIGADALPENMRMAAFDTAVNFGPGTAKKWIQQAAGDPGRLEAFRRDKHASLAAADPEKYGQYKKGWEKRDDLIAGATGEDTVMGGGEPDYDSMSDEQLLAEASKYGFKPEGATETQQPDYDAMSDDELLAEAAKYGFKADAGEAEAAGTGMQMHEAELKQQNEANPIIKTDPASLLQAVLGNPSAMVDVPQAAKSVGRGAERGVLGLMQAAQQYVPGLSDMFNPEDMADVAKQTRMEGAGTGVSGSILESVLDPKQAATLAATPARLLTRGATGAVLGALDPVETAAPNEANIERLKKASISGGMNALLPIGISGILNTPNYAKTGLAKMFGVNAAKVADLEAAGLPINIPSVSDSPAVKSLANLSGELPGGKAIRDSMGRGYDAADAALTNLGFTGNITPAMAGEVVETALNRSQAKGLARFDKVNSRLNALVPPNTPVPVAQIPKIIENLVRKPGMTDRQVEEMAALPAMQKLNDLVKDAGDSGVIPYGAVQQAKTEIGLLLKDQSNIYTGATKQAYGAASDLMRSTAKATDPIGEKAFDLRNKLYSDYKGEEKVVDRMLKKLGDKPESIFATVNNGSKQGGSALYDVMRKLDKSEQAMMRDSLIRQNGGGDDFKIQSWINNYNKTSPEWRDAFFKGNTALRKSHDELAKALEHYKDVGKFGNPSRSGYIATLTSLISGTGGTAVLAGFLPAAKLAGGAYALNRGLSKAMASEAFVKSLVKATQNPKGAGAGAMRDVANKLSPFIAVQTARKAAGE